MGQAPIDQKRAEAYFEEAAGLCDREGIRMLDVGYGRGLILNALAALYPRSRFVGMDLSQDAIAFARDEASSSGHDNIDFVAGDLGDFDQTATPESFDFITTFDVIHDQGKPLNVLKGIHRSLMTVSLAEGGEGLGAMWGEEKTREYLRKAGFRSITTHRLAHDIQNNRYVVTK
jgi:SAM-dependent methyltransferase